MLASRRLATEAFNWAVESRGELERSANVIAEPRRPSDATISPEHSFMTSMKWLMLASSALFAAATMTPVAHAAPAAHPFTVAQAQVGKAPDDKKKEGENKPGEKKGPPEHRPGPPPGHPQPPAAARQKPPAPPHPPQAAPAQKPAPPHPAQAAPVPKPTPPANAARPAAPPPKQAAPAAPPKPQQPAAQQKPQAPPPARQAGPERRRDERHAPPPHAPQQTAPAASKQAAPAPRQTPPANAAKPAAPNAAPSQPAANKSAAPAPGARSGAPAAAPQQPVKPRDAREFIRKDNNQPQRTIKDVRQERHTIQQNGRTVVQEGDRTIVREQNRTFIRHNEDQRFAIGARDVRVDHRDGETVTIIVRPDGVTIINTTDRDGHLIRRVRRDRNGREFVLINNRRPRFGGIFINVPPPHIRMPRNRYIIDADRADERDIYELLIAPPVEPIEGYYSIAQVRYNAALRDYMRRLDLDIHFDTGSWQITPPQMDRLSLAAAALNRAIARNPREVFLIEGHTDAVGSDEDNLSLSDRRAEAVAVALTEEFHVPPENLVTQGYGEQELKEPTQGPSRINRRVAIRRITPLIDRSARR